jgi:hypothetical protein
MTPSPCAAGDATRRIVRPETRRDETRGRRKTGTPRPPARLAFLSDSVPLVASSTCTCQHGLPRTTHYQFVLTRPQRLHHETRDVFVPFVALGAQHREEKGLITKTVRAVARLRRGRSRSCSIRVCSNAGHQTRMRPTARFRTGTDNILPRRRSLKPFATFSARFAHNALALWNDRIDKRQS